MRKNIVMITGASSGIGREFARQLDESLSSIDEFWLIARREERLLEVKAALQNKAQIITMDVTDERDMENLRRKLETERPIVRMLINCAGYGLMGEFSELNLSEQLGMISVNCVALTKMTYLSLPYMKGGSRIIELASSAAFLPQPIFAIYAASKAYVLSFSRALAEELRPKHIYVTAVCPGPVDTEFFDLAERYGKSLHVKKMTMVNVTRVVSDAIAASRRKQTMSVCSFWIKAFQVLSSLFPHTLILRLLCLVS